MSQKWQTLKIFLSSTFRDMHAERDHLLRVVFPELKARCRKLRINLIEIDLRWGVSEHDAETGKALDICLDEIDACRPFFVGLLGERYGWIPPKQTHSITAQEIYHGVLHHFVPRQIMAPDFKELRSLSSAQKQALSNAYQRNFGKYCLKDDFAELAIIRSIFEPLSSYQTDRSFFFFRQETLTRQLMGENRAEYLEAETENQQKLVTLQKEIKDAGLPVFEYNEIEALGQQFLETLWKALQKEAENLPPSDWLAEEAEFHEHFMADRTRRFVGRQAMLEEMQRFCQQTDEANIVVISGEPGSGKSTLMARFVETFSEPKSLMISHFIGASPTSTNLRDSLRRICALLDKAIGVECHQFPDEINDLIKGFSERLEEIDHQVVIVLDAVNQFENRDNAHAMHWLPQKLPNNIRIVISTLPGEAYDALLRRNPKVKPLTGLTADEKRTLVKTYLEEIRHEFPNPQVAEDFFQKIRQATPLYILVALEELRVFGHFDDLSNKINEFSDNVAALFEQVLERLEGDFNRGLVRDCMSYIACGRQGMNAEELQELLKAHAPTAKAMIFPDMLWIRLYRAFGFYLFERSGVIDFFHGQLKEAVLNRYLDKDKQQTHQIIADYFERRWVEPYSRAVEELPYQFYHAGEKSRLKALLLNYEWISSKLEVTDIDTLIGDYNFLVDDEAARLVQQALELSAHVLREDKTQLAGQLHGRLLSHSLLEIQGLLKQAVPPFSWLRPLKATLVQAGGTLIRTLIGHKYSIQAVVVTPDGSRVVSGSSDNTIKIWDLASGQELHTLSGHSDNVNAVAVTPDGSRVISGSSDNTIKIWDLASGQELHTLSGHSKNVTAVAVTPDGLQVVSGSIDNTIRVWDLDSGTLLHTLSDHYFWKKWHSLSDALRSCHRWKWCWKLYRFLPKLLGNEFFREDEVKIAVTSDGSRVISSSYREFHNIKVWDLISKKKIHTLKGHDSNVKAVAMTPDSLLVVSGSIDQTLRFWDLYSGELLLILWGHSHTVNAVVVTPNGLQVVSGSFDKTLKVWDLANYKQLHTLKPQENFWIYSTIKNIFKELVSFFSIFKEGLFLLFGLFKSIYKYVQRKINELRNVPKFSVHTLSEWIYSILKDLHKYVEQQFKEFMTVPKLSVHTLGKHSNMINAVAVTPDGSKVISGSSDNTVKIWDLANDQQLHSSSGHSSRIEVVTITPDGSRVVSGSDDGTIKVWDLTNRQELYTLSEHSGQIMFTPDSSQMVSSLKNDGTIKVWDLASGRELHTLSRHFGYIETIIITPNGSWVVSGSYDNTLKVWNLASGQELHTLRGHSSFVTMATLTHDGSRVVSASLDSTFKVWDLASGKELHSFSGFNVYEAAMTPDGSRVVYYSFGKIKKLKVFDLFSGQELHTLNWGHDGIGVIKVTPDSSRVISSFDDGTIKVWDLASGQELYILTGHSKEVTAIMLNHDGSRVVSVSKDQTLKVWDLTTELLLASINLDASIRCCSVTPDGQTIVAGDEGGMVHFLRLEMPKNTEKNKGVPILKTNPNSMRKMDKTHFSVESEGNTSDDKEHQLSEKPLPLEAMENMRKFYNGL